MTDLPSAWVGTTLGEVAEIVGGSTPKTTTESYWGGDIPWITPDDLSRHEAKTIAHGRRFLTQAGYDSTSTRLVPAGTVLFTSRAPIGYVAIASEPVCTNQGFKSVVAPSGLTSDYLFWYLRHATPLIQDMGSGTTFKEVSKKRMAEVPIPLPPLAEQERIVAAIEQHFSHLDAAEASLHRAQHNLERFRRAVIVDLLSVHAAPSPVGEVAEVTSGPAFSSKKFRSEGEGVRLLRGQNIEPGSLRWSDTRTWPLDEMDGYEHLYVESGDLILGMDRPLVSAGLKLARVEPEDCPALLVQRVARIRPHSIDGGYLHMCLSHPAFIPHVLGSQTGTQLPHITLKSIRRYDVPLPPPDLQRSLVVQWERATDGAKREARDLQAGLQRSRQLRRSVLAAAFSGQLVPQDPADEPASMLLDRIRAEAPAKKKSTRKKKSA